jgi:hypothetical protein
MAEGCPVSPFVRFVIRKLIILQRLHGRQSCVIQRFRGEAHHRPWRDTNEGFVTESDP